MSLFITSIAAFLGFICAGSVLYLLGLLAAAAWPRRRQQRPSDPGSAPLRISVVIPAHDEELVLASTLQSLEQQTYPHHLTDVVVVADNCTDSTASIARAMGVQVMERHNRDAQGKGYALEWAISQLMNRSGAADAFVVADADTWLAPDFLTKIADRLPFQTDSRGYGALQGRYGVLNPKEGWRAALMAAAFDLFNHIKPLGRERLGLSVGLKGNGMAFTKALLMAAPWRGDSVTEDIDYALLLARDLNVRIGYAPDALVRAQMPATAQQAASQRARWEGGRYALVRDRALPLLAEALRRRSRWLCDAAIDLMLPPLAELAALNCLWGALIAAGAELHWLAHPEVWALAVTTSLLGLFLYILGGLRLSGAPASAYGALLCAPCYALWKFAVYAAEFVGRRKGNKEWVRTARTPLNPAVSAQRKVEREI